MRSTRVLLSLVPLLAAACGGSTHEFGAPRTLPAEQRPTVWDASQKDRLGLPDMKPPASDKRWVGTLPAGWEEQPPQPQRFRDLVWRIAGDASTECYFTARTGGGVAGNLDRWFKQFGAEPAAVESLPVVELGGKPGRLLELHGTYNGKPGQGMLLAFTSEGDAVTTLKFTGPEAVVKQNRDKFLSLSKSLRAEAGAAPAKSAPPIDPSQPLPANHPTTQAPAPTGPAPFTATVPAGWTAKTDSPRAMHHTFGQEGEVYVSQLGGNMKAMLDIWRGEMGLPAASDAEFAAVGKLPMLGGEGSLLDVAGDYRSMSGKQIAGARMLVGAHLENNTITFCKLVGTAAEVEAQRAAFLAFCSSLRRAP